MGGRAVLNSDAPEPLAEPGRPDGWWEETPQEAARYDRKHFDRDE